VFTRSLFGEKVGISVRSPNARNVDVRIIRANGKAPYVLPGFDPTLRDDQQGPAVPGAGQPQGSYSFRGLSPNLAALANGDDTPLASPFSSYLTPLGGQAQSASLSGTLSWDCGKPPAGAPATAAPTAAPLATLPDLTMTLADGTTHAGRTTPMTVLTMNGEVIAGGQAWDPSYPLQWFPPRPDAAFDVKAGSIVGLSLPDGWTLAPGPLDAATVAESTHWRGAVPDSVAHLAAVSSTASGSTYLVPGAGDWIVALTVNATGPDGSMLTGPYSFRLHVVS
jgi:hypothetical protein